MVIIRKLSLVVFEEVEDGIGALKPIKPLGDSGVVDRLPEERFHSQCKQRKNKIDLESGN